MGSGHTVRFPIDSIAMIEFRATEVSYTTIYKAGGAGPLYPYIRDIKGNEAMHCISPIHGRSFVLNFNKERSEWIIGKGNGLSFTDISFVRTTKLNPDTWGGLTLTNATRDYQIGEEINKLGIITNRMEYVCALDFNIPQNGKLECAALLQYGVKCPYRLSDFGFVPKSFLREAIKTWDHRTNLKSDSRVIIAADILIKNLQILHSNNVMHNALHVQNYTWALELVDFESARSDRYPYDCEEYEKHVAYLFDMEILQTYEIINYIAWCLGEKIDYKQIDSLFRDYGFEIDPIKI